MMCSLCGSHRPRVNGRSWSDASHDQSSMYGSVNRARNAKKTNVTTNPAPSARSSLAARRSQGGPSGFVAAEVRSSVAALRMAWGGCQWSSGAQQRRKRSSGKRKAERKAGKRRAGERRAERKTVSSGAAFVLLFCAPSRSRTRSLRSIWPQAGEERSKELPVRARASWRLLPLQRRGPLRCALYHWAAPAERLQPLEELGETHLARAEVDRRPRGCLDSGHRGAEGRLANLAPPEMRGGSSPG